MADPIATQNLSLAVHVDPHDLEHRIVSRVAVMPRPEGLDPAVPAPLAPMIATSIAVRRNDNGQVFQTLVNERNIPFLIAQGVITQADYDAWHALHEKVVAWEVAQAGMSVSGG